MDPQYHWVSVADREGDIYEVIREATAPNHLADLLVRVRHDRLILDQPGMTLFKLRITHIFFLYFIHLVSRICFGVRGQRFAMI